MRRTNSSIIGLALALCFGCSDDGGSASTGFTTGDTSGDADQGDGDGDGMEGDGDGDGDPGDGDGDGDTGDGDGDGDTGEGDGDGDTGDGDGDTGDGDGDTGDGDGDTGEPVPCDVPEANLAPATPQVMLVLDKSGSMLTTWDHDNNNGTPPITRWNSLHNVVDFMIGNFDEQMDFGAMLFPSVQAQSVYSNLACVTENQPTIPVGPNGQAVLDGIPGANDMSLAGGTPGEDAVDVSGIHLKSLDPDLPKVLIYISDGAANCGDAAQNNNQLFEVYDSKLPETIQGLWDDDAIPTYVVGIDMSTEQAPTQVDGSPDNIVPWCKMDELGELGGKPKNEDPGMACSDANTDAQDFYSASNEIELEAAMQAILEDAISCVVNLDPVPAFPDFIEVEVDGMEVPKVDDCETEDGWVYVNPNGPYNQIELCGTACEELTLSGVADVFYFCNAG